MKMKAFTLPELLVVMAIMLLLMSAAIPVYKNCAAWTLDVMPEALRYTHTLARQKGLAAMLVWRGNLGTSAICMEVESVLSPVVPDELQFKGIINLDTKQIQIPDYESALVVYDKRGHLCNGLDVIIEGRKYTSTNQLVLDGKTKWLHRSMGEIVN